MTEAHSGIPHDLPEYEPNTNPLPTRWRVQLYRGRWGWCWTHQCGPLTVEEFWGGTEWAATLALANKHAKECL